MLQDMPSAWNVEFYEDNEGCPVRVFLDGLELRELRTRFGNEHFRVLYFGAPGRVFILLHALSKRTAKLPAGDIVKAETRMKRYLEQLDEE